MRLRNVKGAKEIIESNPTISILDPESNKGKWKEIYKVNRIEIEVGCGKGKMLTEMAQQNKDVLYIGIEKFDSVICRAIEKAKELELKNCLFIRVDAINILNIFEKGEIDQVYLSFPDPWPKARHEKRRLTSPKFLDAYKVILKDDGRIRLKTDNIDLYNYSLETMIPYLENAKYGEREYKEDEIKTEFESKYIKLGKKIYYIEGVYKR